MRSKSRWYVLLVVAACLWMIRGASDLSVENLGELPEQRLSESFGGTGKWLTLGEVEASPLSEPLGAACCSQGCGGVIVCGCAVNTACGSCCTGDCCGDPAGPLEKNG